MVASEAGLKFRPIGIISTPPGSLMIQPTQMATQRGSRDSKNLRSLSLILVRLLITKRTCRFTALASERSPPSFDIVTGGTNHPPSLNSVVPMGSQRLTISYDV